MKKIPYYSRFGLVYNTIWSDEELAYKLIGGWAYVMSGLAYVLSGV